MTPANRKRITDAARRCDMAGNPSMDVMIAIIDEVIATAVREAVEVKHED